MAKKGMSIKIKVAIIGAIALIIGAAIQSPTVYEAWKERPIVDISFGQIQGYPKSELALENGAYEIGVNSRNRGHNDGNIMLTVQSVNARVGFERNEIASESITKRYFVYQDPTYRTIPIYVLPNYPETNEITVQFTVSEDNGRHFFQEVKSVLPTTLTYKKSSNAFGDTFQLVKSE